MRTNILEAHTETQKSTQIEPRTSMSNNTTNVGNLDNGTAVFHGVDGGGGVDHDARVSAAMNATASSAASAAAGGFNVNALSLESHPLHQFQATPPTVLAGQTAAAAHAPAKRKGGRAKDEIWNETTILDDKTVVCNHCNAVIHKYGCAKVERVRAHFQNRCLNSANNSNVKKQKLAQDASGVLIGSGGNGAIASTTSTALADLKANRRMEYITKIGMFKRKFAQWVYATGQAFEDIDNEFLVNALRILRADVPLPTREELENELLDMECNATNAKVNKALLGKACCLTIENWMDVRGVSHTNYAALCDSVPYFLESSSSSSSQTQERGAELSAEELEGVLAKHKKCVFYGVVAPETSMLSKATCERIQKKNPQCVFYYGCVRHALRLLVNDISVILPWLESTRESVNELLKVVQGSYKLQSQLPALPRIDERSPPSFSQYTDHVFDSFEAILGAEKELYAVVSRRDFVEASTPVEKEQLKRIQDFVLGETFVQDLSNASKLLLPLQQQLLRFESDRTSISQVYHCFLELLATYASMDWVSKKDKALISSCVKERLHSIYGDAHGVAYMLDPIYLGVHMDAAKKDEVESFIVSYCNSLESAKILSQLEKYKAMVHELKECNSTYWKMLESGEVRAFDFWIERRQFPQLQQLAWAVFSLPNASTAPSKAFSTQCHFIHSRFHTKLSAEKLQKLTQVYCNAKTADTELSPLAMADPAIFTASTTASAIL